MHPIFVIDNQIKRFLKILYNTKSNESTINNNKKYISNYRLSGLFQTQPKLNLSKFGISIVKALIFHY